MSGSTDSLTQQQAFTVGLQCSGAAKQQRHQRDRVNASIGRMERIWRQGGRGARLGDRGRGASARSRPVTQLAAARPGRARIQALLMYI